jgi:2-deoxy-D-gluconate 3-dehydrogenase
MILEAFQLTGKNALVTGSHRGLGAGIALAVAQVGANAACHGRGTHDAGPCEGIHKLGKGSFYFAGDVADAKACSAMVERTVGEFGALHILINNARAIRRAPASEFPQEYWDKLLAVNLTSLFRLSQLAGRHMLRGRERQDREHRLVAFVSGRGSHSGLCGGESRCGPAHQGACQ